jgi:23S rRNA (adenine-N6)-dimethyltransferase
VGASRRAWGWHPLVPHWAERLVAASGVGPGDTVLDVGAGDGAITAPLLATGARVIAVELHAGRRAQLRARFGGDVTVVAADAADLRLPRAPFHVVASPPYAATTALVRRLVHPGSRLRSAHLVLQEQAARRLADELAPGPTRRTRHAPNGAGRSLRPGFAAELGMAVPRAAFRPPPRVPSRVLVLRRR